jgi:hypothetical protein
MEIDPYDECYRTLARGVREADQDPNDRPKRRDRRYPFPGLLASGQVVMRKVRQLGTSLSERPSHQIFDLAA